MPHQHEQNNINGRRAMDDFEVIDTTNKLTYEELQELKKLAQLSRVARFVMVAIFGILSALGLPAVINWFNKHWI